MIATVATKQVHDLSLQREVQFNENCNNIAAKIIKNAYNFHDFAKQFQHELVSLNIIVIFQTTYDDLKRNSGFNSAIIKCLALGLSQDASQCDKYGGKRISDFDLFFRCGKEFERDAFFKTLSITEKEAAALTKSRGRLLSWIRRLKDELILLFDLQDTPSKEGMKQRKKAKVALKSVSEIETDAKSQLRDSAKKARIIDDDDDEDDNAMQVDIESATLKRLTSYESINDDEVIEVDVSQITYGKKLSLTEMQGTLAKKFTMSDMIQQFGVLLISQDGIKPVSCADPNDDSYVKTDVWIQDFIISFSDVSL